MKEKITIECLKTYAPEVLEAFNKLLFQLNIDIPERSEKFIREVLQTPNNRIFVARNIDDKIIAMITLVMFQALSGKRATLEDIVVDKEYRGQGIGRKLLETALDFACQEDVSYVDLTSRPNRIEANNLYSSLGFEKRDTNVFRYIIR